MPTDSCRPGGQQLNCNCSVNMYTVNKSPWETKGSLRSPRRRPSPYSPAELYMGFFSSFSLPPGLFCLPCVFFSMYLQKHHFGKLPFLLTLKYEGVPCISKGSSQAVFNGCLPESSISAGGSAEAAICPTRACTCFYL